jgi:flagellar hook-basal body complex protein FliE
MKNDLVKENRMSISSVSGVNQDIANILTKMREIADQSAALKTSKVNISNPQATPFSGILNAMNQGLQNTSQLQMEADNIKTAYLAGDRNVSLSQVVLQAEKSKLAYEGLVTVRNKILEAYKEIMNMPV